MAATQSPAGLNETFSIYLDLVRIFAAVVVMLSHIVPVLYGRSPIPLPGHEAVVVFFVLSGLVIAHASQRPGLTWRTYANHRIARIGSVSIPAMILVVMVLLIVHGQGLADFASGAASVQDAAWRIMLNLFGLATLWWINPMAPLNAPFWSLNYEIWYYVFFGVWSFAPKNRRMMICLILAAFVGARILLLFPIWLAGTWIYWHRPRLGERAALVLLLLSVPAAAAFIVSGLSIDIRTALQALWPAFMGTLFGANQFIGDWLFALIISTNFVAAASLGRFGRVLTFYRRPIRAAAGYTFSTYLFHAPLITLAVIGLGIHGTAALVFTVAGIALLARASEHQLPRTRQLVAHLGLPSN